MNQILQNAVFSVLRKAPTPDVVAMAIWSAPAVRCSLPNLHNVINIILWHNQQILENIPISLAISVVLRYINKAPVRRCW